MLKILQARLKQYVNCELPDVQAGFRKGRGTVDEITNIQWIIKKAREFQKTSTSALLTMPKALTVWITTNCGKFWKRWGYRPPDLPLEKWTCNNRLVPNRKRSTSRLYIVYCHCLMCITNSSRKKKIHGQEGSIPLLLKLSIVWGQLSLTRFFKGSGANP